MVIIEIKPQHHSVKILDLAEENALPYSSEDDQFWVTVLPPTNATDYITNEDPGDEDGVGTINNLPGSMLLATALIEGSSCKNVENIEEPEGPPNKRKKKTDKPKRDWVKTDLKSVLPEWTSDDDKIEELRNKKLTPKGYFELFFDDEVLNLIVANKKGFDGRKNVQNTSEKRKMCFENSMLLFRFLRRMCRISVRMQYLLKKNQRKNYDV